MDFYFSLPVILLTLNPGGRFRYDKEFLLSLRDSPLTRYCPSEINRVPEIILAVDRRDFGGLYFYGAISPHR